MQNEKEAGKDSGHNTTLRTAESKRYLAAVMPLTELPSECQLCLNYAYIVALIISVEKPYFDAPSPERPKTSSMCCTIVSALHFTM